MVRVPAILVRILSGCWSGGGGSRWRGRGAGGDFHADGSHLELLGEGQEVLDEAEVVAVGGVDGHEDGVEGEALDGFDEDVGLEMAGDTRKVAADCSRAFSRAFDGRRWGEDAVELVFGLEVVDLPEVEVIGAEVAQALLEEAHGAIVGAVGGLAW